VSAGQLNESHPVLRLFAPADSETTSFAQPTEGALNHPPASRVTQLTWDGAFFNNRFVSSATVFDVRDVVFLSDSLMHIFIIIALVSAKVLLDLFGIRAINHDRNDQIIGRPLVVFIGSSHVQSQRCAVFIDQQMNLTALFASICGISARFFTTQGRRAGSAVNGLPFPANLPFRLIIQDHCSHHVGKDAPLLPGLKAFMDHTTGDSKPVLVNRFPLAASPQHIPNPMQSRSVLSPRTARSSSFRSGWQKLSDRFPQFVGHFEVIDIFRFCGIILAQDASVLGLVVGNSIIQQERLFC